MTWKLIIEGPPRTKKNHQRIFVNKRTGKPFVTQAATAKAWEQAATLQLRSQWHQLTDGLGLAISEPVNVAAWFYRERATGDLVNYMEALADALERGGVLVNDRQIVSWDGSRLDKDAKRPRVEVEISHAIP